MCKVKKNSVLNLAMVLIIAMFAFSCQKGSEPIPYSDGLSSSSNKSTDNSNLREGDFVNTGEGGDNGQSNSTNPKSGDNDGDDLGVNGSGNVIGGDDNEDDDDVEINLDPFGGDGSDEDEEDSSNPIGKTGV